ncbi:MAG: M1 family metallopeptidase [Polyangiaceae bacterium]
MRHVMRLTLAAATLLGASAPAAAWADTNAQAPALDVANYTMTAKLDPVAHTVHGEGTITLKNTTSATLSEVWLHLYLNAFKNQRSAFMRDPVGGFRGSQKPATWGAIDLRKLTQRTAKGPEDLLPALEKSRPGDDDETDARVPLREPLEPGKSLVLDVVWDDTLPSIVERTGFDGTFHFVGQWFPKLAKLEPDGTFAHFPFHHLAEFYSDFGTYDVTVDVPAGYLVAATGPSVSTKDEGGRHVERHVQAEVHDFAFGAFDTFERADETLDGVKVSFFYPRGYAGAAARERDALAFAIPHFRSLYGKYPYETLSVVHPPNKDREAGGMEYPTLITTGGPWHGPPFVRELELVTIHEFGHQYFYGLLASNEAKWPFLDEGLNSYAEARALRTWLGPASVAKLSGLSVSGTTIQLFTGRMHAKVQPIAQPAAAFASGRAYGGLVYGRTATLLETLARVYGEDKLTAALGAYTSRHRMRNPVPEDLLAAIGEHLGDEARALTRAALFDQATIDYAVVEVGSQRRSKPAGLFDRNGKRETESGASEDDYEGYALVEARGTLQLPLDVAFVTEDGAEVRTRVGGTIEPHGRMIRVPYTGTKALRGVVLDPEQKLLLDDDFTNNHAMIRGTREAPQNHVFALVTTLTSHLVSWLSP